MLVKRIVADQGKIRDGAYRRIDRLQVLTRHGEVPHGSAHFRGREFRLDAHLPDVAGHGLEALLEGRKVAVRNMQDTPCRLHRIGVLHGVEELFSHRAVKHVAIKHVGERQHTLQRRGPRVLQTVDGSPLAAVRDVACESLLAQQSPHSLHVLLPQALLRSLAGTLRFGPLLRRGGLLAVRNGNGTGKHGSQLLLHPRRQQECLRRGLRLGRFFLCRTLYDSPTQRHGCSGCRAHLS